MATLIVTDSGEPGTFKTLREAIHASTLEDVIIVDNDEPKKQCTCTHSFLLKGCTCGAVER